MLGDPLAGSAVADGLQLAGLEGGDGAAGMKRAEGALLTTQ